VVNKIPSEDRKTSVFHVFTAKFFNVVGNAAEIGFSLLTDALSLQVTRKAFGE
jgi:hypothetical protein